MGIGAGLGYAQTDKDKSKRDKLVNTALGAAGGILGVKFLEKQVKDSHEIAQRLRSELGLLKRAKIESIQDVVKHTSDKKKAVASILTGAVTGTAASMLIKKPIPKALGTATSAAFGVYLSNRLLDKLDI